MDHDETIEEFEDYNFGKEIGKAFVISTASTVGMVTGFILIGYAYDKYKELKKARKAKKKNQEKN